MDNWIVVVGVCLVIYVYGIRGLFCKGDFVWVIVKEKDVIMYLFYCSVLIMKFGVLKWEVGWVREVKDVEVVVDCYDDDILGGGEVVVVVEGGVGVVDCEVVVVEEDEDWFEGLWLRREGRLDVEGEVVFILGGVGGGSEEVDYLLGLGS